MENKMDDNMNFDMGKKETRLERNENTVENLHSLSTVLLTSNQIDNVYKCCRSWWRLYHSEHFWKKMCETNGFLEVEKSIRWSAYTNYIERFQMYWQGIFHYNRLLQHCWKNNIFKRTSYDSDDYYTIEYFDDEIFVTRAEFLINIHSSFTGELISSLLNENNRSILKTRRYKHLICFLEVEDWLVIGVWNMKDKKWFCYMDNSENVPCYVQSLSDSFEVFKTIIAIRCAKCSHLYVYNIDLEVIVFKSDHVTSVCSGADMIAFGNNNGTVQFLDLDCNPLMKLDHGEKVTVKQMKIFGNYLYCVTVSNRKKLLDACVWSIKEKIKLYEIKRVCSLSRSPGCINETNFIFYHRHKITIWNFLQGNHPLKVRVSMRVSDLFSNDRYVITCFEGEPIAKMWCTTTGNLVQIFEPDYCREKPIFLTQRSISFVSAYSKRFVIQDYTPFAEF